MAVHSQKLKTLYLMEILHECTDEEHPLSASELSKILEVRYGLSAERKSIYNDIEVLKVYGMDIIQKKGANAGYYVGERYFQLPELKLLVDAVQSSKFITQKKSIELIGKLEGLTSRAEARQLNRQVYIYNRIKTGNETIYYNVDHIHSAIFLNRQIQFQYVEWTCRKELRLKRNGEYYRVSPWALTWDDENYYLIAYAQKDKIIKHYRVDKMRKIDIMTESRVGKETFENFDLAEFAKKTFGMYGGYDEQVTLICHNQLAGVILDRFGQDVMMVPVGKEHFRVTVLVAVSQQFFGWLTGIGKKIHIVAPKKVKKEYQQYLEELLKQF
ncbi:MAG: WYL domain-containing transcriptional regulator [Lachnospiraceae bacterium]|nr:WYL domain-containing transcriptional regulator [Lachnospiraceae bacterium]